MKEVEESDQRIDFLAPSLRVAQGSLQPLNKKVLPVHTALWGSGALGYSNPSLPHPFRLGVVRAQRCCYTGAVLYLLVTYILLTPL